VRKFEIPKPKPIEPLKDPIGGAENPDQFHFPYPENIRFHEVKTHYPSRRIRDDFVTVSIGKVFRISQIFSATTSRQILKKRPQVPGGHHAFNELANLTRFFAFAKVGEWGERGGLGGQGVDGLSGIWDLRSKGLRPSVMGLGGPEVVGR